MEVASLKIENVDRIRRGVYYEGVGIHTNGAQRCARRREERIRAGVAPSRKQRRAWKQRKKLMRQNILYLMMVNLPTEQEMEAARIQGQRQAMMR